MSIFCRLLASLGLVGFGISGHAQNENLNKTIPLHIPLDLGSAGSSASFDVLLTRRQNYELMLEFTPAQVFSSIWQNFIGTGQKHLVAADSVGTNHPVIIESRTAEEQAFLKSGGRLIEREIINSADGTVKLVDFISPDGTTMQKSIKLPPSKWVYTSIGAGETVPLHVTVNFSGGGLQLFDETLQTVGTVNGGTRRAVISFVLDPGTYHFRIDNLAAHPIANGANPQILLTYNPKINPPDK